MQSFQKDFKTEIKVLFVVAVVSVIITIGAVMFLKTVYVPTDQTPLPTSTPVSQPQTPSTSDNTLSPSIPLGINSVEGWQTYHNNQLEFKYPSNWIQSDAQLIGSGSIQLWVSSDDVYALSLTRRANQFEGRKFVNTVDELFQSTVREKKKIMLGGVEAIKLLPKEFGSGTPDQKTETELSFLYEGSIHTLSFESKTSDMARVRIGSGTFDQILSTFRFVEPEGELKPADAETPAAGACWDSGSGDIAVLPLSSLSQDNVPIPRCFTVKSSQSLQITNQAAETIMVTLGRLQMTIEPGETQTDSHAFGTYLAPGVHGMTVVPNNIVGVPEIWLK
jgi:hypothetical protein